MTTQHARPRVCPVTGQHVPLDRYAAPAAAGKLRAAAYDLPSLMAELETTLTRQLRMSGNSAATDDRLPFNPDASERAWILRQTLLVWVDDLARRRHEPTPDTWHRISETLVAWSDWLTTIPDGPQVIDEILDAYRQAMHAIDRPADRTYAGPCPTCSGDIYGRPGSDWVRCTTCGTERDLDDARQAMLDKLAVMHLPAADAARAVTLLTGQAVTPAQVRRWKHRGLIEPTEVNRAGQPLYDLAELVKLAAPERIGA